MSLYFNTIAGAAGVPWNGSVAQPSPIAGSAARFDGPLGVALDSSGNIFVADLSNAIYKITPSGVVSLLAGSGTQYQSINEPPSPDGNPRDPITGAARLRQPVGLAVDSSGNVYVTDFYNNIRKITAAGVVTTFYGAIGNGVPVEYYPDAATLDSQKQSYISWVTQYRDGYSYYSSQFSYPPNSETLEQAKAYQEYYNYFTILGITLDSIIARGSYTYPPANWLPSANVISVSAALQLPPFTSRGLVNSGHRDWTSQRPWSQDINSFNGPRGLAVSANGNFLYVSDYQNHAIKRISIAFNVATHIITLAGAPGVPGSADGTLSSAGYPLAASTARLNYPAGIAVDSSNNVFVADFNNHTIRKITNAGVVTTLAGTAGVSGDTDGTGAAARFYRPHGIAVDAAGNVYVAEFSNHTIRKITSAGVVTTIGGTAGALIGTTRTGYGSADGEGTAARFYNPNGIAATPAGDLYVADYSNYTIRTTTTIPSTITFNPIPTTVPGLGPFTVSPTSNSSGPIVLTSSDPAVASVNGFTITPLTQGTVTITASQASYLYFAAATPVSQTLVVDEFLAQTLTFPNPNIPPKTDQSLVFVATATASSGLPVVLTSSNPAVATVSGFNITPLAIGTTTITASQAGNLIYSPATATQVLTITGTTAIATAAIQYIQNCGDMQYYTGKQESVYVTTNPTNLAWPNPTTSRITAAASQNSKLSFGSPQERNDGTTQFAINQGEPPVAGVATLTFSLAETDKYKAASLQKSILISRPTLGSTEDERERVYVGYASRNQGPPSSANFGPGTVFQADDQFPGFFSKPFQTTMYSVRTTAIIRDCSGAFMSGLGGANSIPMIIFATTPSLLKYYDTNPGENSAITATIGPSGYGINWRTDTKKTTLEIYPIATAGVLIAGGSVYTTGGSNVELVSVIRGGEYLTPNLVFNNNERTNYLVPFMAPTPTGETNIVTIDPRIAATTAHGLGTNKPTITRKIKPPAGLVYYGSGYSGTAAQVNASEQTLLTFMATQAITEGSPLLDPTKPRFGISVYTSPNLPYKQGSVGDYYDMPSGVQPTPLTYGYNPGGTAFLGSENWAEYFSLQPIINCYKIGEYLL